MVLMVTLVFILFSAPGQASPSDPWSSCPVDKMCKGKFADGVCDKECSGSQCLRDGFDCLKEKEPCKIGHIQYCRDHYDNKHCEHGCNKASCGWDGLDCYKSQRPNWAKGALVLQTTIPFQKGPFQNSSLLWALSILLQTSVKLRGVVPFQHSDDLSSLDAQQLVDLHRQAPTFKSNRSLLFLQVDNRPCTHLPFTCFPYATEAADFLNAVVELRRAPAFIETEIQAIIGIRGIEKEITVRETTPEEPGVNHQGSPSWMWPVVGVATGMVVALAVVGLVVLVWFRRRRARREGGGRVRHRSTATDNNNGSKAWTQRSANQHEGRSRSEREKDRNGMKKKKKKGKELGKKRREPLGEDAIRMRPLRKDLDIGSDTDMTQSSMEDINRTICDHRSPAQKHFSINHQQPAPVQAPPRRWDRNATPTQQRIPSNSAPVQWCGPDGSVVLIRAVRSGLDRVVLELLRAGVPVNNTDHTGRSALHWACSVNHLSLARTLIRYGAAVDLQDHKGETALFLSALHGCYETTRFLLLNGANQELTDRRGRRPIDVAREGMHHQVLELLLAHRVHRSPFPMDPATEVLWDDRAYLYSSWVAAPPCLPGRSASFSGVIAHRDMASPPPSDWQMLRAQCASPQSWRPPPNQSATALVSPRILGRPSRPISTLQEVTSEAEEEERETSQDVPRPITPHFLSPQPAPRQRSFSCTQHALQRRFSGNQPELSAPILPEKQAKEHVEIVVVPHSKTIPSQEGKGAGTVASPAQVESEKENKRSCESKGMVSQSEVVSKDPTSIQTVM
ncbi:neurogenic locus notch homolog protein 1 isoform X2 [Salminus brasiliensis]|uniref:neurogenic locus notch homolog protein 1 isoform X2 n=1 Tax=Salminus brasiliensis TaxID=930266 RepID=UPI003B8320BA